MLLTGVNEALVTGHNDTPIFDKEIRHMANEFGELKKNMSFTQKGRLIKFHGMLIRQNQEVVISWGPADSASAIDSWEKMKTIGQLPPSVKMVFLVDRVGIQCVEISAIGGPGFQNVTLETFVGAPNPMDMATETLRTWLIQEGENIWMENCLHSSYHYTVKWEYDDTKLHYNKMKPH